MKIEVVIKNWVERIDVYRDEMKLLDVETS